MERSYPGPGRPRGRPSALPAAVAQPCRHAPSPRDPAASSPPARTARARKTRLQSCSEVDLHHRQTDPRDLESRTGIWFRRFAALTQPHTASLPGVVWVPATFAAWMVVLCRVGAALPRHLSLGRLVWGVGGAICAAEHHNRRGKGPPPTRRGIGIRQQHPPLPFRGASTYPVWGFLIAIVCGSCPIVWSYGRRALAQLPARRPPCWRRSVRS